MEVSYIYDTRNSSGWYFLYDQNDNSKIRACTSEWDPPDLNIQGRWTMHVIRGDGTDLIYTVDDPGVYKATQSGGGSCVPTNPRVTLATHSGSVGSSGQYFMNGKIAEFAVFDGTVLSDADIADIWNAKRPLVTP